MSDYDLKLRATAAMTKFVTTQREVLSQTDMPHDQMLRLQGEIRGMEKAIGLLQAEYKGLHG